MTLEWEETAHLMKVVAAKDRRTVGPLDIDFWHAAAREADWPGLDFAMAAVVRHTNDAPGVWLEPGHITAYWRELRSEARGRFHGVAPTRENIDDLQAQQIANDEAARQNLQNFVLHFINPRANIDPRLSDRVIEELQRRKREIADPE